MLTQPLKVFHCVYAQLSPTEVIRINHASLHTRLKIDKHFCWNLNFNNSKKIDLIELICFSSNSFGLCLSATENILGKVFFQPYLKSANLNVPNEEWKSWRSGKEVYRPRIFAVPYKNNRWTTPVDANKEIPDKKLGVK